MSKINLGQRRALAKQVRDIMAAVISKARLREEHVRRTIERQVIEEHVGVELDEIADALQTITTKGFSMWHDCVRLEDVRILDNSPGGAQRDKLLRDYKAKLEELKARSTEIQAEIWMVETIEEAKTLIAEAMSYRTEEC